MTNNLDNIYLDISIESRLREISSIKYSEKIDSSVIREQTLTKSLDDGPPVRLLEPQFIQSFKKKIYIIIKHWVRELHLYIYFANDVIKTIELYVPKPYPPSSIIYNKNYNANINNNSNNNNNNNNNGINNHHNCLSFLSLMCCCQCFCINKSYQITKNTINIQEYRCINNYYREYIYLMKDVKDVIKKKSCFDKFLSNFCCFNDISTLKFIMKRENKLKPYNSDTIMEENDDDDNKYNNNFDDNSTLINNSHRINKKLNMHQIELSQSSKSNNNNSNNNNNNNSNHNKTSYLFNYYWQNSDELNYLKENNYSLTFNFVRNSSQIYNRILTSLQNIQIQIRKSKRRKVVQRLGPTQRDISYTFSPSVERTETHSNDTYKEQNT